MIRSNETPRACAASILSVALAVLLALAGCNLPMPKASQGVISANQREPAGADAHGVQEAIRELALLPQKTLTPNPEYARFPRYIGTLGGKQVEMKLGAKTGPDDDPSGVHGEYQFVGNPAVYLVAGDRDGDTLEVEESNDGTHITGNWIGKFAADGSVSGERMDPDDSNVPLFDLRPAVPGKTLPLVSQAKPRPAPAASSLEPAPLSAPNNAVSGTSNVIIGE
ncbi:hypothetical protein BUMB_02373 [Candidatus Paraburkholderia calva]|nr:hypothetical protein BUMB_02373 [Candidatus Paraburkholderia calva]